MTGDANAKGDDDRNDVEGRRYVIRGRVQGVGFRWWTQREACALNLTGAVFNRPDGAVEISVRGTTHALSRLETRLLEGPPAARVDDVEHHSLDPDVTPPRDGFEIVRPG